MSVRSEEQSAPTKPTVLSDALVMGAQRIGIDACVYLPDSCLTDTIRKLPTVAGVMMIPCAREDEGIAIAMGLYLGGRMPACLMEASGLGYSGLILARALAQRTPLLVIASHTRGPGEPFDYHGATCLVSEGIFKGLGIPYSIAQDIGTLPDLLYRIGQTIRGQLTTFGLLIPPHLARGDKP